ncbi:hypothetical protein Afil01_16340 [Actinorhabdospora filicis]|uniref:DUF4190 domain-containing protein n=1 Tax=Actinorhabdospora filicis TaxID=1785913 RepID=A0A9W6SIZ4_9ACTN|nr:hypothetical protein [Actinorhabdospora filicis]GLZ76827.1 hypothetical protein Afil01_16340 [Actinorhabdospora filicis]
MSEQERREETGGWAAPGGNGEPVWPGGEPGATRPPVHEPAQPSWDNGEPGATRPPADRGARPFFDDGPVEDAPVTAIPGPDFRGAPIVPPAYRPEPLLPPVQPPQPAPQPVVRQPMGAPTPVPPRIGRPQMPYGYTGQLQPGPAGYQLMLPQIKPIHSGPAIGGVLAGSAAILTAVAVLCAGVAFRDAVFGIAFTVLAVFLGGMGLVLSFIGLRQVRLSNGEYTGRGTAITGMVISGAGLFLTILMFLVVAALSTGNGGDNGPMDPTVIPTHGVSKSPAPR